MELWWPSRLKGDEVISLVHIDCVLSLLLFMNFSSIAKEEGIVDDEEDIEIEGGEERSEKVLSLLLWRAADEYFLKSWTSIVFFIDVVCEVSSNLCKSSVCIGEITSFRTVDVVKKTVFEEKCLLLLSVFIVLVVVCCMSSVLCSCSFIA